MKAIEDYASRGKHHDVMEALELLTKAYILMCGYSYGYRTVVFCAAEAWIERLAWLDFPLSEMARKAGLVEMMPNFTSEYDPEKYNKYDIAPMNDEELFDGCEEIIGDKAFDEATTEVLCWGILELLKEEVPLSREIEAVAPDGTPLKGILTAQKRIHTWVTMVAPYKDLSLSKYELVRKPETMLVEGYSEYQRLKGMEEEIRALYPKYQEEFRKVSGEKSAWMKARVFDRVYDQILKDTILATPSKLFQKWFGIEIFDIVTMKDPSWLEGAVD